MAQKLLDQYKTAISELALIPSSGGAFEVRVDGATVYSKLKTGTFPDERALVRDLANQL